MRNALSLVVGAVAAIILAVAVAFTTVTVTTDAPSDRLPKSQSDFDSRVGNVQVPPNYGK
jgi:hypothetical protein